MILLYVIFLRFGLFVILNRLGIILPIVIFFPPFIGDRLPKEENIGIFSMLNGSLF